jgi:hypothetical protein
VIEGVNMIKTYETKSLKGGIVKSKLFKYLTYLLIDPKTKEATRVELELKR